VPLVFGTDTAAAFRFLAHDDPRQRSFQPTKGGRRNHRRRRGANRVAPTPKVDMKLEVIAIPVADLATDS
jgi:hypothetical protein